MSRNWWKCLVALVAAALAVALGATAVDAAPRPGAARSAQGSKKSPEAGTEHCGGFRFSVKTGTDPDARHIHLGSVRPATVAALTALPAPRTLPTNSRIPPTETTVFRVHATLDRYAYIPIDSDYHLILKDAAGHTMITEIPDPACVGGSSPLKPAVAQARATFDARYQATGNLQNAGVPVTVIGIGFFDRLHGQVGVAPNGIELHPVLHIWFGARQMY